MGVLAGKTILVTGVFTEQSIAFGAARLAQVEGARLIFTGHGRRKKITEKIVLRLPEAGPVLDLDVTEQDQLDSLAGRLSEHTDHLDGILHCVSASKPEVVGAGFLTAEWEAISTSFEISAASFQAVTKACLPILRDGASIVGVTLDGNPVWPVYGWAGVAKSAYEATSRYLAFHLGARKIRVNLIACGPLTNFTMGEIDGIEHTDGVWESRAPLSWDRTDQTPVAKAIVALLSDWFPATTGEIIHVDGGYHAMGM